MSDLFNPPSHRAPTHIARPQPAESVGAVTTLSCRHCGGATRFGIDEQHVECIQCGEAEHIHARSEIAPLRRAEARPVAPFPSQSQASQPAIGETQISEITCPTCGGAEIFVGSLASTSCPFCAGELLRTDAHQLRGDLRVDGIIPFQVEPVDARAAIERWVGRRHLAPDSFSSESVIDSLQSMYLGAYLFDLQTLTTYRGQRGDVYVNSKGEKSTRWSATNGTRRDSFGNGVVIASGRIEDGHSTALAPWPLTEVRDFDQRYLAGHLSHTVDRAPEDCVATALDVIDDKIQHSVKMVIGGDKQRVSNIGTIVESAAQRHLLVPVWISTLEHQGETHHVVVNGATGAVSGSSPRSNFKIVAYATLAVFVLACLIIAVITLISTVGVADGAFT